MIKPILFLSFLIAGLSAQSLTLDEALKIALENNRNMKISQIGLKIAEAQYQQALSSRYPQLTANAAFMRMDEDPIFKMQGSFLLPQDFTNALALSSAVAQDEITAMMTGQPSTHTNLSQTLTAVQSGAVPAVSVPLDMDVKQMDRDLGVLSLDLMYPLYTGGKTDAIIRQAELNKNVQSEEKRRTEAQVIYDVKRYYYGVMLAQQLSEETRLTLERMKMVRDLTEAFYTGGSMRVKKTDYLRTNTTLSMIESVDEELRSNIELAKSALINAMGLPWDARIELPQTAFETPSPNPELATLIDQARRFNPMANQLKLAIDIHQAKIDEAQSAFLPSIALTANAQRLINSYDGGVVNDANRNSWTIGVGVQWNFFDGFRSTYALEEARLGKMELKHKDVLLNEGLALQVKHALLTMGQTSNQFKSLDSARNSAAENADLNIRAYQEDMVETKDVIEAQIMETITKMSYLKNLHGYAMAKSQLEYIIASQSAKER